MRPARLFALLVCVFQGCATAPPDADWRELLSKRGVATADVADPLTPSEAMRRMAGELPAGPPLQRLAALQAVLFDGSGGGESTGRFRFQYDARGTYDAAAAFDRMSGNCVAFTNLFISMGRLLGVPLRGALARRQKGSRKEGGLIVVSSHVVAVLPEGNRFRVYDFNAEREGALGVVRLLDDASLAAVALSNRSIAELQAGEIEAALRGLALAARLAPDTPSLLGNLGVGFLRSGNLEEAAAWFERARRLSPGDPTILYNVAMLHVRVGRRQDALETLRRVGDSQATPYTLLLRGNLELAAGNIDAAHRSYQRARQLSPGSPDPLVGLARVEELKGHEDEARRLRAEANALTPEPPPVPLQ